MHVTDSEINTIKGLLHYLNSSLVNSDIAVNVELSDSNGEGVGVLEYIDGEYLWRLPT